MHRCATCAGHLVHITILYTICVHWHEQHCPRLCTPRKQSPYHQHFSLDYHQDLLTFVIWRWYNETSVVYIIMKSAICFTNVWHLDFLHGTAPMDSGGRSAHSRRSSSVGGIPMEAEGENPNSGSRYNYDRFYFQTILRYKRTCKCTSRPYRHSFSLVYTERNKESPTFWIREPRMKAFRKMSEMRIINFPTWKVFRHSIRILSVGDIQDLPRHTVYTQNYIYRLNLHFRKKIKCSMMYIS